MRGRIGKGACGAACILGRLVKKALELLGRQDIAKADRNIADQRKAKLGELRQRRAIEDNAVVGQFGNSDREGRVKRIDRRAQAQRYARDRGRCGQWHAAFGGVLGGLGINEGLRRLGIVLPRDHPKRGEVGRGERITRG